MGTLTIRYACGCMSMHSLPGHDSTSRSDDQCSDCWRASHKLLTQEHESLSTFVSRRIQQERKRR
jgi:hypothetical protein